MKKRILILAMALLPTILLGAQPLMAIGIDYSANDINYYDSRGNNVCGGNSNVNIVSSSDNEKTIFFSLIGNGFTKQEAAAALGNIQQESSFNPKEVSTDGNNSKGIVQWNDPGRWNDLTKWAGSQDPYNLNTQIGFIFYELNNGFADFYKNFKAATTLEAQVSLWADKYEVAGVIGPRLTYAQAIQQTDWYRGAPEGGGNASTGSGCTSGGASQYVDGFVVYSQYDPRWANKPYGSSTVADSGCGPSAMAMIVTNLTGQSVTPDVVAQYAASKGMYVPGAGSSWSIGPVVAEHWHLSSKALGKDVNAINAALRSGALIITSGQGPVPFTGGGHFIVIRAIAPDGKWFVGDSAHPQANSTEYDQQQIMPYANGGSIYAISK